MKSFFLELMVGIEPTACSLRVSCSAIEPHQRCTLMFIILKKEYKVNKYLNYSRAINDELTKPVAPS